jgi:hypothetical protein
MKRIWNWLGENKPQLQGLAAVVAICGVILYLPSLAFRWLQPQLEIRVTADESTVPLALEDWLRQSMSALRYLPGARDGQPDLYQSLRDLQTSGPLSPDRTLRLGVENPGRIRVDVVNQTDHVISGVRLRLDRAYPAWGVQLIASFLTPEEVTNWQRGSSAQKQGPGVVLPELPPLPPKSAVTVVAYGDVASAEVSVTGPSVSFKMIRAVRVEDKWPISALLHPYWIGFLPGGLLIICGAAYMIFDKTVRKRMWKRAWRRARVLVPYDLACDEAKAGHETTALAFLEAAVAAGYDDFEHMRNDPDLDGLRKTDAFKKISKSL